MSLHLQAAVHAVSASRTTLSLSIGIKVKPKATSGPSRADPQAVITSPLFFSPNLWLASLSIQHCNYLHSSFELDSEILEAGPYGIDLFTQHSIQTWSKQAENVSLITEAHTHLVHLDISNCVFVS
jgi:hypothetical protein